MLLYLAAAGADLQAVGSVHGNVSAEQAARNSLAVLELAGRGDLPVAVGADTSIAGRGSRAAHVHGEHGLGGAMLEPRGTLADIDARDQLLAAATRSPISLIATGAATNVAAAITGDASFARRVHRAVVMGGAVTVPGNVNDHAEANVASDPEAFDILLGAGLPLTLVGLDVTRQVVIDEAMLTRLAQHTSDVARFAAQAMQTYADFYTPILGRRGCLAHDPLAGMVLLDPALVTTASAPLRVVLDGPRRGQVVVADDGRPDIQFATGVDTARALQRLEAALTGM